MFEKISERSEGMFPIKDDDTCSLFFSKYLIKSLTILRSLFESTTTLPISLIPPLRQMYVALSASIWLLLKGNVGGSLYSWSYYTRRRSSSSVQAHWRGHNDRVFPYVFIRRSCSSPPRSFTQDPWRCPWEWRDSNISRCNCRSEREERRRRVLSCDRVFSCEVVPLAIGLLIIWRGADPDSQSLSCGTRDHKP